jgi:tetratricopeptide (TPR) repeat protein
LNNNTYWLQRLAEANRLYRGGQTQQASQIYQQVRAMLERQSDAQAIDNVIVNPDNLPDNAQNTWERLLSQGSLNGQSLQSLRTLVQTYPQFMPGYLQLAQALESSGRRADALSVLDRAATLFPDQVEVVRARVQALTRANRASDAAIAALQFSVQNPNSPYAAEFRTLAENAMKQAQAPTRTNQTRNTILGSVLQGGLSYLLTGQTSGPLSAVQGIFNMLRAFSPQK